MSAHVTHRTYWVYILASKPHGTLYIGVTNSLERWVWQHKTGATDGFTRRYDVNRLIYFEEFRDGRTLAAGQLRGLGLETDRTRLVEDFLGLLRRPITRRW